MKNIFFILILLTSIQMYAQQKNDEAYAIVTLPTVVTAGDSFQIDITIVKPNLKHYGEFRQILPEGFKPYEKNSGSAEFQVEGEQVNFIWLRLPNQQRFTISYGVVVDPEYIGNHVIKGEFIYLYNNQRGSVMAPSKQITVTKPFQFSSNNNKNTQNQSDYDFPPKDINKIQVIRKMDPKNPSLVTLQVSLGNTKGGAKIEERIPPGYKVEIIDAQGSNFSFFSQNAEFLWSNLPMNRNFELKYKLIPTSQNVAKDPVISGEFLYVEKDKVLRIPVIENTATKTLNKNGTINKGDVYNFFNEGQ